MEENIYNTKREEKQVICPELSEILKLSEENRIPDNAGNIDDILIENIVDALVDYGKDRGQIIRVAQISKLLSQKMGLGEAHTDMLEKAALIYDIGNLKIDPTIYKKGKRLSFEEFEIIKEHTLIGYEILRAQKTPLFEMAASLSVEHHEWFDGSGYPYGLVGSEISTSAKIVALSDTVSALFVPRYGRQAIDFGEIIPHVEKRKGTQFDPVVAELLIAYREEIGEILEYGLVNKEV